MDNTASFQPTSLKILSGDRLFREIHALRASGQRIVFTNGCFDLLHPGHIEVLEQARRLGDILVVALNTDRSVFRLKGPKRPIVQEENRARVIAALACVSFVTFFDEETPENLIRQISPEVLVKGGDWAIGQIAGAPHVLSLGGTVHSIPLIPDSSTTGLIERICDRYSRDSV